MTTQRQCEQKVLGSGRKPRLRRCRRDGTVEVKNYSLHWDAEKATVYLCQQHANIHGGRVAVGMAHHHARQVRTPTL